MSVQNPLAGVSLSQANATFGVIGGAGYQLTGEEGPRHEFSHGFDIRITPANGGTIISVSHRELHMHLSRVPELYVIPSDQDLGTEITKILTMSCLKKDQE